MSFKDRKFGRLTIRRQIAPDIFECDCACGNLLDVWRSLLASGVQRDCGMCRRMVTYKRKGNVFRHLRNISVHGHVWVIIHKDGSRRELCTREWNTWKMMVRRCHDKNFQFYP